MKNKILILCLICGIMIIGSGCGNHVDSDKTAVSIGNRFVATGDYYFMDDIKFEVYEDTETKILYLVDDVGWNAITVWYDENGEPMKADK